MKIQAIPTYKRPREKLLEKGAHALTDAELVAVLLRTGYTSESALEVAQKLFVTWNIRGLRKVDAKNIAGIKGIGIQKALILKAALELGTRSVLQETLPTMKKPRDVLNAISFIRNKKREYFLALYLNARNQLMKVHTVSIGTVDMSIAHPRDVFTPAITENATSIILAHNHPSGDPRPSNSDIILTQRIMEAGEILDIRVKDHIIVTSQAYYSLQEEKML